MQPTFCGNIVYCLVPFDSKQSFDSRFTSASLVSRQVISALCSHASFDDRPWTGHAPWPLVCRAVSSFKALPSPPKDLSAQPAALLADLGSLSIRSRGSGLSIAPPWALKPFYGVLTDHVPFLVRRRKSYLILMVSLAALAYGYLAAAPLTDSTTALFWCLLLSVLGVAFSDVVVDALMIEHGQPRGLTGRFQSIQWAAIYTGSILTGWLGGKLTADHDTRLGFVICAAALSLSLVVCFWSCANSRFAAAPILSVPRATCAMCSACPSSGAPAASSGCGISIRFLQSFCSRI